MIKAIKKALSRLSVMAAFSGIIFMTTLIIAAITAILSIILIRLGYINSNYWINPYIPPFIMFQVSILDSIFLILLVSRVLLRPIKEMIKAMRELAHGNFNIEVHLKGWLRLWELQEFCDNFNNTAKELNSIEMLRSDFVNNFSHEFKTPIVSLRGFAKLLKEDNLTPEEREEYLNIIISESERLAALSTNVLNLTKIENQTIVTEKSNFDLSEQIRRAILMMESKWSEKKLDLDIDLDEIKFNGNAELLNQIWVNILDNAVKFSPEGEKLEVKLFDLNDSIAFKVKDHGLGMNDETKAHMFDKFYQGDMSHATEGNGLGMAVVKKIITLHQGELTVDSEPGKGTLIIVTLPKEV